MQQFALLRQRAREGDAENTALLERLQQSGRQPDASSDWDMPLVEVNSRYGTPAPRAKGPAAGTSQDELAYYKAVAANKRGEDALVDHAAQKSEKHLKPPARETKRQRLDERSELDGFRVSERNQKFNERLS